MKGHVLEAQFLEQITTPDVYITDMIQKISTLANKLIYLAALVAFQGLLIAQDITEKVEVVSVNDDSSTVDINITNPLDEQPGMYGSEMIAIKMPVAEVHASTIEEIEGGLVTAWFGGTKEGSRDVVIWLSRNTGEGWAKPLVVADGINLSNRTQQPCWNPVLFRQSTGSLILFYKVGPSPSRWWGMMKRSDDEGLTWKKPIKLPNGYVGPVRSKPIELSNRTLLCGSSLEDSGWYVQIESFIQNRYWSKSKPLNSSLDFAAIQPTLLKYPDGSIQALCRSKSGRLTECWTTNGGKKWSRMRRSQLPNPNAGADGTVLADGRALLVYNHTREGRSPLNVAISKNGKEWDAALVLENQPGEYSYPAVIQTSDGNVHITYTHNRTNIKHIVIDPSKLKLVPITQGQWPQ